MKHFYFLVTLLMVVCQSSLAQMVWDGTSSTWTKGEGTATDPYLIETPQNLSFLKDEVNSGKSFEGIYFKLVNNLDMGGEKAFGPIGSYNKYTDTDTYEEVDASKYFLGIFDGNFKTIDNLYINLNKEDMIGGTGLFACINKGTVIKNLTIGKKSVVKGGDVTGAFVGQMTGGQVLNCKNDGSVTAGSFTSGIVGTIEDGTISGCVNSGKIIGQTEVGGIVGQAAGNNSVITYCYNIGTVQALGYGGAGIAGALYDKITVKNCYNIGNISGLSNTWMGSPHAITADAGSATVSDCYYVESLTGQDDSKATVKTIDEMKSAEMIDLLNKGAEDKPFATDDNNINNGYPILAWQKDVTTGIATLAQNSGKSSRLIEVRSYDGKLISAGRELPSLSKGIYLITKDGQTSKILIK